MLALLKLCSVLCDIDVTRNGDVNAVVATGIDVDPIEVAVTTDASMLVLFHKYVAIVAISIFNLVFYLFLNNLRKKNETLKSNE